MLLTRTLSDGETKLHLLLPISPCCWLSSALLVENLVFLFFEFLGSSNTICGIAVALTVLFEIPIFHVAPTLLRNYGVGWLLLLANAFFVVRVIGYTLIQQ